MKCIKCGNCCKFTQMQLTNDDIRKIKKLGFKEDQFIKIDKYGFAKLKNRNGYCVFYDTVKKECKIYENRPRGCILYPIIYDPIKKDVIIDSFCPSADTITEEELKSKRAMLIGTIKQLYKEARKRSYYKKQKN
ncbi:MAG: YkgJ family cysteine cluster protein [Nitrososphaeria archaeon]